MDNALTVQCVYGDDDVAHLYSSLLPSLRQASQKPVVFHTMNYDPASSRRLSSGTFHGIKVFDWPNPAEQATGFATNHNYLFHQGTPQPYFVIINPDCIATQGSFDHLVTRKSRASQAGIVESRQWPFEHPKEYDENTLETPWASGACALIDSEFYGKVGGMSEEFYLYGEDVDLSWKAWLAGYRVVYEPNSVVIHFSDGPHRRPGEVTPEVLFSISNDLALTHKYFGPEAAERAIEQYHKQENKELVEIAVKRYRGDVRPSLELVFPAPLPPQIKRTAPGRYHEFR